VLQVNAMHAASSARARLLQDHAFDTCRCRPAHIGQPFLRCCRVRSRAPPWRIAEQRSISTSRCRPVPRSANLQPTHRPTSSYLVSSRLRLAHTCAQESSTGGSCEIRRFIPHVLRKMGVAFISSALCPIGQRARCCAGNCTAVVSWRWACLVQFGVYDEGSDACVVGEHPFNRSTDLCTRR
jgi:hypothetical protein